MMGTWGTEADIHVHMGGPYRGADGVIGTAHKTFKIYSKLVCPGMCSMHFWVYLNLTGTYIY